MTNQHPEGPRLRGRRYSTLSVGEEFWDALTVTETHVVTAAGIFNDPGPIHVNVLHGQQGRFGARVVHGTLLSGIMVGILGNALGSTVVAMLELSTRWLHPTHIGDTLIGRWEIVELAAKPAFAGGGLVTFTGEGRSQDSTVVLETRVLLAVGEDAPWDPGAHVSEGEPAR